MPISAQQWRLAVGHANASRSLRPQVTGQPKMKLTTWNILLFIITVLLGPILVSGDGGRGTGEKKCASRGSGGDGGTVGELAPSLLTVPWRKELLMLAGDVETNPGPYTDYGLLTESDLDTLVEEMSSVNTKWESIGQGIFHSSDHEYLTDIHTSYSTSHDCMREMLRKWLQVYGTTTWGRIIRALRSAGEPKVADNLKAKYIPDLLEESDLDLLKQELRPVQQKWWSIGHEFPYPFSTNDIRHQYHHDDDRLRAILKTQLQSYYPITWRNIVDALRSPVVGQSQLADQLEAKYCPNLLAMSDLNLLVQELTEVCEKWQHIGEELGVSTFTLSNIKSSKPGDRLKGVFGERLKHHTTSWGDIIAVLRSSRVGEFQVADHLETKYYPTAQQILQKALEKGYVDCHIWKVLVTGAAGSGKTTLKHRLFGKEPPSIRCSTALAEAAIRAISREIVGTNLTDWFQITTDELMELLGGALKAGVPMEDRKLPSVTPELVAHEWPTKNSAREDSEVSTIASSTANSCPNPTLETDTAVHKKLAPNPKTDFSKQSERDPHSVGSSPFRSAKSSVATSFSAHVSSAKGELVQLVEKTEGSKRFLELQWIHFIDSGGQPQFHEVLPAFIRNTTATIFVMKLSERLDEHPMVELYDENGQLCGKRYRHALSNNQMLQCCVQTIHSRPSTREGTYSKTLVVGTHRDLESSCSESRAEKNKKLVDVLTPSLQDQLVYYRLESEVIFPINSKTPDEQDHQVCAMIRKQIEDKKYAPPPYKIPIGWFLLEQGIIKSSKEGVISRTECLGIAAVLGINTEALTAALEYFDDLNIFLYYPSVLSKVLFSEPQVLLDKVTELVHFSYTLRSESPPVALEGKWLQFRDKGIVKLEMFRDERFSAHYIPDLFTPADLIKLFQHLLIIAPLSSTEYFMPSLLRMITPEEVNKQLPPTSSSAAPLLVHFPAGCVQNGVFCALVVYLISVSGWKFAKGNPLCVSRNCVCFQLPGKPLCITLVDSFTFFELHVKAPNTMYPELCPMIRIAIFSGLKAAAESLRYNNSTPVPAFVCTECSSSPHAATIDDQGCYLTCTVSTNFMPLTKKHTVWLQTLPPSPEDIEMTDPNSTQQQYHLQMPHLPSQSASSQSGQQKYSLQPPCQDEIDETFSLLSPKPTQKQLLQQLYHTVADKWNPIGIYLEIPEGQLNALDAKHRGDPQKCLMAMLTESWLPRVSPPPTWQEIAEAVEFVGHPDVAQRMRDKFCSQ